jgi:hypothetical protein
MAPRSRLAKLSFLVFGLGVALYLGGTGPREQHVRIVLGDGARDVTGIELQYVGEGGDVVRDARMTYGAEGGAPRVVSHEPKLPDGTYRLLVDVHQSKRRVSLERSVTLGGGSSQVDLSAALLPPPSTDSTTDADR